jgi:hypothetical protein
MTPLLAEVHSMTSPEIWIGLGGLVLHLMAITCGGIWAISKIKSDMLSALSDHRSEVQRIVDSDRRIIQESLSAIRQKINDVENDGLKTYVRRDSFHEIMNRVSSENAAFRQVIEARFDRQDVKIDRIIERQGARQP